MVCSFFYKETKNIKKYFLENNSNFSQLDYLPIKNSPINNFVDKEGDIYCIPNELGEFMVDGFYSVKFIKND